MFMQIESGTQLKKKFLVHMKLVKVPNTQPYGWHKKTRNYKVMFYPCALGCMPCENADTGYNFYSYQSNPNKAHSRIDYVFTIENVSSWISK